MKLMLWKINVVIGSREGGEQDSGILVMGGEVQMNSSC